MGKSEEGGDIVFVAGEIYALRRLDHLSNACALLVKFSDVFCICVFVFLYLCVCIFVFVYLLRNHLSNACALLVKVSDATFNKRQEYTTLQCGSFLFQRLLQVIEMLWSMHSALKFLFVNTLIRQCLAF